MVDSLQLLFAYGLQLCKRHLDIQVLKIVSLAYGQLPS